MAAIPVTEATPVKRPSKTTSTAASQIEQPGKPGPPAEVLQTLASVGPPPPRLWRTTFFPPRKESWCRLKDYRNEQSLTQEDFAARCGVLGWRLSRGTLAKIEAQVRCVSDAELVILARALKKDLEQLYPANRSAIIDQLSQADE